MNRTQFLIGLVAVALMALGTAAYFVFFSKPPSEPDVAQLSYELTKSDHTLGNPAAPVTMIEYAAPTCPVCAHFNNDMFPAVKQRYIDTGKVYYVFRVFPLQAADVGAEAIARCLPKDNYFSFIDMLYHNQPRWDPDGYQIPDVRAALLEMANVGGLPAQKADGCMQDQDMAKRIEQVGIDAETRYGVSGTPTFLVNGQLHGPFQNVQDVENFIDPMLAGK